jgi:hypothetical protein
MRRERDHPLRQVVTSHTGDIYPCVNHITNIQLGKVIAGLVLATIGRNDCVLVKDSHTVSRDSVRSGTGIGTNGPSGTTTERKKEAAVAASYLKALFHY